MTATNQETKLAELAAAAPGLEITTEADTLAERSHDYWMRSLLERRRDGGAPTASAVVRPGSTEDVAAVLAWAERTRTAVVPYGLGSGVCGAILAQPGQVVLDLGRMASLVAIDETSLTARVQPGMRGSEFEQALEDAGYTMGHWPQSIALSTVGGWCATRASGQFSTLYGNIEDMLLGCEAVLAGGRIVRLPAVPRAATGPDLKHLLLGSEGTLGVFTELTLRIHPAAERQIGLAYALPDVTTGVEILRRILRAGWTPAVTRLYDATEAGRNFAHVAEGQPVLLLWSEGTAARVETEAKAMAAIAEACGGASRGEEPVTSWLAHRNEVPTFESLLDQGLVADTIEVAIDWGHVAELFEKVTERGGAIEGVIAMSGHISHCYTQGANIYFTFVGVKGDEAQALALYDRAWETTLATTHELGGTVAHHHGIGRVRKAWLERELGEGYAVLQALKATFDPHGILNPGALVDPS